MRQVELIAASGHDLCIGRGGMLPFRLPDDLQRFRSMTMGKPVIMGRKTWDSLPRKPLAGRLNVVLSRRGTLLDGATMARSPEDALVATGEAPTVMVIGGAEIYRLFLPIASIIHLTLVDASVPDGDAFFPEFRNREWTLLLNDHAAPSENGEEVRYQTWIRD